MVSQRCTATTLPTDLSLLSHSQARAAISALRGLLQEPAAQSNLAPGALSGCSKLEVIDEVLRWTTIAQEAIADLSTDVGHKGLKTTVGMLGVPHSLVLYDAENENFHTL